MEGIAKITAFLKTTAGMVTAAATLLAAIAGLLPAISKLRGGESPAQSAAPTTVLLESDAQRELRGRIPEEIWATCGPPIDPDEGAVAAVNCKYRDLVGLQYNLFASTQELRAAYAAAKRRYRLASSPGGTSCVRGNFEAEYRDVGRFVCFVDEPSHVAAVVWTDERFDILSYAWRDDENLPALLEAWQTGVGPEK